MSLGPMTAHSVMPNTFVEVEMFRGKQSLMLVSLPIHPLLWLRRGLALLELIVNVDGVSL